MGVHLGPAAVAKLNVPLAGMTFISWEYRDKNYNGLQKYLIHGYTKSHLLETQKLFWEHFKQDPQLKYADIIACGFDTWHCLIFAPFNKKLVLNSAYRFDGHIDGIHKADIIDLQNELYPAVRYNPDVILAGAIIYDVMYHQHFLGSHKMIPLPAACDYVQERLKTEIYKDSCPGIPRNTKGYHPTFSKPVFAVSPKRLSPGGKKIANDMIAYFKQRNPSKYEVVSLPDHLHQPYKYCQLGNS